MGLSEIQGGGGQKDPEESAPDSGADRYLYNPMTLLYTLYVSLAKTLSHPHSWVDPSGQAFAVPTFGSNTFATFTYPDRQYLYPP